MSNVVENSSDEISMSNTAVHRIRDGNESAGHGSNWSTFWMGHMTVVHYQLPSDP